jgi:peroxiredoxin
MKKLFVFILIPFFLYSCQTNQKKEEESQKQTAEKQEKQDPSDDVKATTLTEVGQKVPDFSFRTTEGNEYTMNGLQGKVVLLNFFATWCPSCMDEMPALQQKVWDQYKDNENFFMVSLGREHTMEEMKDFQNKKGYSFRFAPDTGRVIYGQFAEKYIPRNVVVDKEGQIIYQCAGYNKDDFQEMLELIQKEL